MKTRENLPHKPIPKLSDNDTVRFWKKVNVLDETHCWDWKGYKRKGYGCFQIRINKKNKNFIATRISYFIHNEICPPEKIVLHTCDNPSCVNPNHLRLGTNKENTQDMMCKNRGKQQFKNGKEHIGSKLNEFDVVTIREQFLKGFSQSNLSVKYSVCQSLISRIVNRKLWTHI